MKYIPVAEHEELVRDSETGAILAADRTAYEAHLKRKGLFAAVVRHETEIKQMNEKLDLILTLLQKDKN